MVQWIDSLGSIGDNKTADQGKKLIWVRIIKWWSKRCSLKIVMDGYGVLISLDN